MQLSTVTLTGVTAAPSIVEDIDFLLGTDSTSYPLAQKLRNINLHYYDAVTDIIASNSNWEWDDTNKTDFPIGTATLVAGQQDYALPSNFLRVLRIEVMDAQGNYQKLDEFDEEQIGSVGLASFMSTDGMPVLYREIGNSIELYPAPAAANVTLVAGLKVYYQRTQTEFTNADAAVSPGFAAPFHRLLSIGAAYDYAFVKTLPIAIPLKQKLEEMRVALKAYYASRNREVRPAIRVRHRNYE